MGKINELGAEVAREDADKVVDAIRSAKQFYETDAFLLVAGAAGGTGSGSISVVAQHIKARYGNKPIYALIVLPFEHEEETEVRTICNTATCLKSVYPIADAVFLIDNQRYIGKGFSLRDNLGKINTLIVEPFYDLLCAGEEKKVKHIGARVLDAGDILQTLSGWTVIGYGKSSLPMIRFPIERMRNFRRKSTETYKGIQAMDEAIGELSLRCDPADSGRALYLLSAPTGEMTMDLVKELGDYLKELAPEAVIRYGDYPRERGALDITVVLSQLSDVEKVRKCYNKSASLIQETKRKQEEVESKLRKMKEASKGVPSILRSL